MPTETKLVAKGALAAWLSLPSPANKPVPQSWLLLGQALGEQNHSVFRQ